MSFTLTIRAGPARLASRIPEFAKASSGPAAAIRAFHKSAPKTTNFFTSRTTTPLLIAQKPATNSLLARLQGARRGYQYQSHTQPQPDSGLLMRKLLYGGAMVGGTWVTLQFMFNRETRADGGMPPYERSYLNKTFMHTGLGIGIIGLTAYQMLQTGFTYRLMVTNPWVVAIGGLALSFGSMLATRAIDPDKYVFRVSVCLCCRIR